MHIVYTLVKQLQNNVNGFKVYGIAFNPKCPTKTEIADVRDTIRV